MGRHLGLVIGINHYQDTAFRPLQFPEIDARALAQWLVNTKGGHWSPSDVQVLLGAQATREQVERQIMQVCLDVAGPDDIVFIYFAGHAFLDDAQGQGYLALTDTHHQAPATGLHLPTLVSQSMGRSQAAHILFLFDYFQTGPTWSMLRASPYDSRPLLGPSLLNVLHQVGNRSVLCSCRGNEFAPETGEQNLGILMYHTILGLCGPLIDPTAGPVTLQRLQAFLATTLDEQHSPQLFGQERTPLVLAATTSSSLRAVPPATGFSGAPPASPVTRPITHELAAQGMYGAASVAQLSPQQPPPTNGAATSSALEQRRQQSMMLLQQARYLVQMQQPIEALLLIEQSLQAAPTNTAALVLKGQLLGTTGRFPEAMQAVEQLLQIEPNNALAWSMRAALLANMGQFEEALQAVDRSLALDPHNAETQTIKSTIMVKLAVTQTPGASGSQPLSASPREKRGGPLSFFAGIGLQLLGLLLGIAGAALLVLRPDLPFVASLALESLGLTILCANSARGTYRYGLSRIVIPLLTSLLIAAALFVAYRSGQARIFQIIAGKPARLIPLLFLGLWLVAAAILPLLLAIGAWFSGLIRGVRRRS
ncbi:MAG: tetratricopeptide repeat protein [Ktedonobacteraceae bacterium]|nr:tetratricopeptide repeat protein [Ktedonobacteraceae bacterium]